MTAAAKDHRFDDPRTEGVVPIPLRELRRAPWNARKSFDPTSIAELRASIRQHGIQVPLIVRPIKSLEDVLQHPEQAAASGRAFEIVAGHRRFEAALNGGTKTGEVPCIIRGLTDDQAREVGLVDNLQREDVPALEEADAYAELKQRLGTPEAIAARVGKDVSYVARRLQLVSLAELPRRALAEQLITVDHALLFARLGADEQDLNLKWCLSPGAGVKESVESVLDVRIKDRKQETGRYGYYEPQSVLNLKHHIEEYVGRKLSRAPWSLDDAELISSAGACNVCPSNTKANTNLFSDLNIAAATCENGGCFEVKREAFVQIRVSKATHDQFATRNEPAIRISFKSTTVKPRVDKNTGAISIFQTFKDGQWIEAKPKSCEHARLGVAVDWYESSYGEKKRDLKPGAILSVCIAEKCKAHKKAWEQTKGAGSNGREDEAARKARQEKAEAAARAESKIRVAVASKALDAIDKIPAEALRNIARAAAPGWGDAVKLFDVVLPGWKKTLQTGSVAGKEFAKAIALVSLDNIAASEYGKPEDQRDKFLASVKRIGFANGADAWKQSALKPAAKAAKKVPAKKAAKKGARK